MRATVVDLRYRMNDVLKALDRNEDVEIMYRGRKKGVLVANASRRMSRVTEHPFFRMRCPDATVDAEMSELRGGRYPAL